MQDYFDPGILEALSKQEQYTREAQEHNLSRRIALNQKTGREEKADDIPVPCCYQQGLSC